MLSADNPNEAKRTLLDKISDKIESPGMLVVLRSVFILLDHKPKLQSLNFFSLSSALSLICLYMSIRFLQIIYPIHLASCFMVRYILLLRRSTKICLGRENLDEKSGDVMYFHFYIFSDNNINIFFHHQDITQKNDMIIYLI